jgi:NAD(P)-dependent dehydrogenase (short-subunit alcohol dehydrogenase family)
VNRPAKTSLADTFSIQGLRVAVTAAGQGIGRAMAERFTAGGAKVAACDVNGDLLTALQRDLPDIHVSVTDVSETAQVEAFFEAASARLGGIDVLVNNAGIGGGRAAIEDIEYDDWNRTVNVNLNGMFYCIKQVAPIMKRQRSGCIVNISTSSVRTGLPYRASYVASKAGVEGLTYNVARELGEFNIRCNAILPGMMARADPARRR